MISTQPAGTPGVQGVAPRLAGRWVGPWLALAVTFVLGSFNFGCDGGDASHVAAGAGDAAAEAAGDGHGAHEIADGGGATEDALDGGGDAADASDTTIDPCPGACIPANECPKPAEAPSCLERCEQVGPEVVDACLASSVDCSSLTICLGMVAPIAVVHPFDAVGATGTKTKDLAGDFTVETTAGPFTLSERWTGVDSFVVLLTAKDNAGKVFGYPATLWKSDLAAMLKESPKDVHYLFASLNDTALVLAMETEAKAALMTLPLAQREHWQGRLHFVTTALPPPGSASTAGGWLGKWTKAHGRFLLGIDPFQRVREFGLLYLFPVEPQGIYLRSVAIEAQGWGFERARADAAYQGEELVIDVAVQQETASDFTAQVTLPSPAVMAKYDTLLVEMINDCPGHQSENCGEWDYLEFLRLCERPVTAGVPSDVTPCTAGSKRDCPCEGVDGSEATREQSCKADGSGYGACGCACAVEFGRWITTYSREGTWWTDLTPQLAHLQREGTWPMRWQAPGQPKKCDPQDKTKCWETRYVVTARLHLQQRGKGSRPFAAQRLPWPGGIFDQGYNTKQQPYTFDVPPGTKKVEVVTLVSGHGFGADVANCAEFCNHEHHVAVNGGKAHVRSHPEAGTNLGCKQQIAAGVVPNQFGTWPLGRGGWCPGLDVKPWVVDITTEAKASGNTLTYEGLFQGQPYTPVAKEGGSGFWGRIDLTAWLVFSK